MRNEKTRLDNRVYSIDKEVYDLSEKIGSFKNEIKTLKQRQEELRKKLTTQDVILIKTKLHKDKLRIYAISSRTLKMQPEKIGRKHLKRIEWFNA